MKRNRIMTAAAASMSAAVVLAASAGAYMTTVAAPSENLTSSGSEWSLIVPEGQTSGIEGIKKLEYVVSLAGDAERYERELGSGVYESDGETAFVNFTGHIGIGARLLIDGEDNNWYDFGYTGFETSGNEKTAVVEQLNDNTYLFTCELNNVEVLETDRDVQFTFKDWGNTSDAYSLTVEEFFAYYDDGTVAVYADADGNAQIGGHDPLDRTKYGAEEETAPAETTEATTTAAPETTTAAAAETTTAAETAAAPETTEAAADNGNSSAAAANSGTVQTASTDFGSRDTSLIIVGIIAGLVIIVVIVVMVLLMLKKKK